MFEKANQHLLSPNTTQHTELNQFLWLQINSIQVSSITFFLRGLSFKALLSLVKASVQLAILLKLLP